MENDRFEPRECDDPVDDRVLLDPAADAVGDGGRCVLAVALDISRVGDGGSTIVDSPPKESGAAPCAGTAVPACAKIRPMICTLLIHLPKMDWWWGCAVASDP
jgi:hypothetical protein